MSDRDRDEYQRQARLWTETGDRHVLNGDNAAANVSYDVATENQVGADLTDLGKP